MSTQVLYGSVPQYYANSPKTRNIYGEATMVYDIEPWLLGLIEGQVELTYDIINTLIQIEGQITIDGNQPPVTFLLMV